MQNRANGAVDLGKWVVFVLTGASAAYTVEPVWDMLSSAQHWRVAGGSVVTLILFAWFLWRCKKDWSKTAPLLEKQRAASRTLLRALGIKASGRTVSFGEGLHFIEDAAAAEAVDVLKKSWGTK